MPHKEKSIKVIKYDAIVIMCVILKQTFAPEKKLRSSSKCLCSRLSELESTDVAEFLKKEKTNV